MEQEAFSVDAFCKAHQLSRAKLYDLWKSGEGPDFMRVGSRVLISKEAASAWRQAVTCSRKGKEGGR
jgi:hypothetical protein